MNAFTPDQLKIVTSAIHNTWQAIGSDVLACAEGEPIDNESAIECCIDAERIQMYGGPQRLEAQKLLNEAFEKFNWKIVMKQLKKTIKLN